MMAHDKALMTAYYYRIQHCPARRFNHEIRLSDLTETPGSWDGRASPVRSTSCGYAFMTGGRLGNTYGFKRLLRGVRHRHSLRWGAALLDRCLIVARLARGATGALARRRSWQCARLGGIADSSPSCRADDSAGRPWFWARARYGLVRDLSTRVAKSSAGLASRVCGTQIAKSCGVAVIGASFLPPAFCHPPPPWHHCHRSASDTS